MIEWIISSSVLIAIVIVLRFVLKGRVSPRLQYALWALVLVRLLVPISFGHSGASVQNIPAMLEKTAEVRSAEPSLTAVPAQPLETDYATVPPAPAATETAQASTPGPTREAVPEPTRDPAAMGMTGENAGDGPAAPSAPKKTADPGRVLKTLWLIGVAAASLWFAFVNIGFRSRLRRSRRRLDTAQSRLPVFISGAIDSPCLAGVIRPAIYVTPEAAAEPETLNHVLTHELAHFSRGDHILSLLRCVCLALHWYNPLVWAAAILSRRDSELACDAASVKALGEDSRKSYAKTLIELSADGRGGLFNAAASMKGSRYGVRDRVRMLAKRPKTSLFALAAVLLAVALSVCCTFTGPGGKEASPGPDDAPADSTPDPMTEEVKAQISAAYEIAKRAAELHGIPIRPESGSLFDSGSLPGTRWVSFDDSEIPLRHIVVAVMDDGSGGWTASLGNCRIYIEQASSYRPDISEDDVNRLVIGQMTVSRTELSHEGVDTSNETALYNGLARFCGREEARLCTEMSESSPVRCIEAECVSARLVRLPLIPGEPVLLEYTLVLRPADDAAFVWQFGGLMGNLYESPQHPEYDGYYSISSFVSVVPNELEGYTCIFGDPYDIANDFGWGAAADVDEETETEARMQAEALIANLLEHGQANADAENLMRVLYAADLHDLDGRFGAGSADKLFEILLEVSVNADRVYDRDGENNDIMWFEVFSNDQAYRDMYMLRAAVRADDAVETRYNPILYRQRCYDKPLFDRLVRSLPEEERERIFGLMHITEAHLYSLEPIGDIENTVIETDFESELLTYEEYMAGVDAVLAEFEHYWRNCTLANIAYRGDAHVRSMQEYGPSYEEFGCVKRMVLFSNVLYTGEWSTDPDEYMPGMNWWLILTPDGRWIVVDHGY